MSSAKPEEPAVTAATSNGIDIPDFELPYPDKPELITQNLLRLFDLVPDERVKFVMKNLVTHLHAFVNETSVTTEEWMKTIEFLTKVGQTCTPIRQEFILFSDVMGVSALVDAINNPPVKGATSSSVLGPFFTEDAPEIELGESIASEGKGKYMYVEGTVRSTDGTPVPGAVIETWETDESGFYDTQYKERDHPDCRGRLRTDKDGKYGYRAITPVAYPIPGDGPVGQLLLAFRRHNLRPNHLHLMVEAPGFRKLVTSLYPDGDPFLATDAVFGVKKDLVVKLEDVNDDAEARKRGFPKGGSFKLLKFDITLVPLDEAKAAFEEFSKLRAKNAAA
ncbi:hypothetical protein QCA50_010706 [Cerrena zonata]|uniref:Aromatic compound dioxygenase n=1 Tax=Cerrena zonata TaxID=2478898 RepID=A0AAW0G6G2_9APHY